MPTLTVSDEDEADPMNPNSVSFKQRSRQLELLEQAAAEAKKRDKNSPFSRWTQYNNEHTKEMMWLQLKHPKAAAILTFLVDQMDEYNAVMCSYQVIQELLGISRATTQRNIQVLKEHGYIAILKSGTSNIYAINDSVYWKSWGNNKKYSKFPANVVLSLSEQEKVYQLNFADITAGKVKAVDVKD